MTLAECLKNASLQIDSDSPRLDAEVLLAHVLGKPRSHLYAWPEKALTLEQQALWNSLLKRRLLGEPIAHLTGEREFFSLSFRVNQHTLIPRPATETLVEAALELMPVESGELLDLGAGSGAIAIALSISRPNWVVLAIDQSAEALEVARVNNEQLQGAVSFIQSDWFDKVDQQFDVIVSNPPYIDKDDPHLREGDVRFEPLSALVAGQEGLADIKQIIEQAPQFLKPKGHLLFEHGFQQACAVRSMLEQRGFDFVKTINDLDGHPRVTLGCWQ